jgi:hypothetical protein
MPLSAQSGLGRATCLLQKPPTTPCRCEPEPANLRDILLPLTAAQMRPDSAVWSTFWDGPDANQLRFVTRSAFGGAR